MNECQNVAHWIWRGRQVSGLNTFCPIRSFDDALFVARHHMQDESETIICNVAESLYDRAKAVGTVRSTQSPLDVA